MSARSLIICHRIQPLSRSPISLCEHNSRAIEPIFLSQVPHSEILFNFVPLSTMSPPYGTCSACWSARVRCTHAHSSAGPSSQGRDQQQPDPYAQPRSSTAPRVHTSSALGSLYYLGVSNNQTYHYHPPQGQTTHQGHTHIPPPPPPPPTTTAPPQGPQGSFAPSRRGYHGGLPSPPTTSSSVDDHGGYHQAAAGQHSQAPTPYDDRSIAGNQGRFVTILSLATNRSG